MRNPPCCIPLQKATKLIAIVHTVFIALALLVLTVSLVVVAMNYTATNVPSTLSLSSNTINIFGLQNFTSINFATDDQGIISKDNLTIVQNGQVFYSEKYVVSQTINQVMSVLITAIVVCATHLVLGIQLWKGANDRNLWPCYIWFLVQLVNCLISFILIPIVLVVMVPYFNLALWIGSIVQVIFEFYVMWVVYAFIKELELGEGGGKVEGQEEAFITK